MFPRINQLNHLSVAYFSVLFVVIILYLMLRLTYKRFTLRRTIYCASLLTMLIAMVMLWACNKPVKIKPEAATPYSTVIDSANNLFYQGRFDGAVNYIDSAIKNPAALNIKDKFDFLYLHYNYYDKGRVDTTKAMFYANSMLALLSTDNNSTLYTKEYCMACFSKGDAFYKLGRYNDAFKYYYLGKMANNNDIGGCSLGDYSYRMGMTKYKRELYADAAVYFKQSFNELGDCDNGFRVFYRSQEVLDNIGLCYSKLNQFADAEAYFNNALNYIHNNERKFGNFAQQIDIAKAVVYGNYAEVLLNKRQYVKAEAMLKASIAINLVKGRDYQDAELTELKLAKLFVLTHRPNMAFALLQLLKTQLADVKNDVATVQWNLMLAEYYKAKGDYAQAYKYLAAYNYLDEALEAKDKAIKQYDASKEMRVFDDARVIKDQERHRQLYRIYLLVAMTVVLLAVVIIILTFYVWRRSRSNLSVMTDLNTRINEQNISLQNALQKLETANHEKDRILHAVAHDLRNPLGGIASLTAMLVDDNSFDAEHREFISMINLTAKNSIELINEILEATMSGGVKPIEKKLVDINTLLSNSIELMRFKAAEKNQHIMLKTLSNPETLLISSEKIWRVINNLISNAIKFSPEGAVIKVRMVHVGAFVQIEFSDKGIGIPDNLKKQVFNMFTEAKRPGTNGEKSFGLGLSVSKQIIESHNGDIWFESHPDGGTSFYIKLKRYIVA